MSKFKTIALVAAMSLLAACAADTRVPGESLDSGLGELPASYTGWEYMPAGSVRGESLDSGLGELGADYTASEFMPSRRAPAESLVSDPKLWPMPL